MSSACFVTVMGETKILRSRPRPRLSFWVSWNRDQDRDFHFGFHRTKTETETFILGLLEPRPRPRLWVSWNQDKDLDFCFLCLRKFLALVLVLQYLLRHRCYQTGRILYKLVDNSTVHSTSTESLCLIAKPCEASTERPTLS